MRYFRIVLIVALAVFAIPAAAVEQQGDFDTEASDALCVDIKQNLRYRSSDAVPGGEVSLLQDFLYPKYLSVEATGFFGKATLAAVKKYQADLGLTPTGFVGPLTRAAIKKTTCDGEGGSVSDEFDGSKKPGIETPAQKSVSLLLSSSAQWVPMGGSYTIFWAASGATACFSPDGSLSDPNGTEKKTTGSISYTNHVSGLRTYTLTCEGPGGSVSKFVSVRVGDGTVSSGTPGTTSPNPEGALLRVVGVYEAANAVHSFCLSKPGTVTVEVPESTTPVVLALTSYEPVQWVLKAHPGANIKKIILAGYNPQSVSGVNAPIERYTYYAYDRTTPGTSYENPGQGAFVDGRAPDGVIYHWAGNTMCADTSANIPLEERRYLLGNSNYFYAYKEGTSEYQEMLTKLKTITGLSVSSFVGAYSGSSFVLPPLSAPSTGGSLAVPCTSGVDCVHFWTKPGEETRACSRFANTDKFTVLEKRLITCTEGRCVSPKFYWIFGDIAVDEDRPSYLGPEKMIERIECSAKCSNPRGCPGPTSYGPYYLTSSTVAPSPAPAPTVTSAPSVKLLSPLGGASYRIGDTIPVKWTASTASAKTQVTVIFKLIKVAEGGPYTGVSGGTWQGGEIFVGSNSGIYEKKTGPSYLEIPGVYEINAYLRECHTMGCNLTNPELSMLAKAIPVQISILASSNTVSPPAPGAATITLTAPNGGTFVAGSGLPLNIQWSISNPPVGAMVCATLIRRTDGKHFLFNPAGGCVPGVSGPGSMQVNLIRTIGYDLGPGSYDLQLALFDTPRTDGKDTPYAATDISDSPITLTESAQATPESLAKCIAGSGAKLYGAFWCPHCKEQEDLFGTAKTYLPRVECSTPDGSAQLQICKDLGINSYPTWIFASGVRLIGVTPLATLAVKTSCPAPTTL